MTSVVHTRIPYARTSLFYLKGNNLCSYTTRGPGRGRKRVEKANVVSRKKGYIYFPKRDSAGNVKVIIQKVNGNKWGGKQRRARRVRSKTSGRLVKSSKSRVKKPKKTRRKRKVSTRKPVKRRTVRSTTKKSSTKKRKRSSKPRH